MGLEVRPESRCSAYDRERDYRHSQSLEPKIAKRMGGIRCRYTGQRYRSLRDTEIEHVVATSEAHDSGLCAASAATKRKFANDLLNLTLSNPTVNRQKGGKDAGEWMPRLQPHEFAKTVILVKLKYGLSIDRREKKALEAALEGRVVTALPDSMKTLKGHPLESVGRQRERTNHLRRGDKARDRSGPEKPPGLRLHAGRRRRRLGL